MPVDARSAPRLTLLLPEGWVRLATTGDTAEAVGRIVDRSLAGIDARRRDVARLTLRRRLEAAVAEASDRGVYELWMPIAPTSGVSMPASVAVARLPSQPDPGRPVAETLIGLSASAAGAIAVEIAGVLGIRVVVDQPARLDATGEIEAPPTRLVNYIVSPLAAGGEWLVFTASIMVPEGDDGPDLLRALEFAIDGMMATVSVQEEQA